MTETSLKIETILNVLNKITPSKLYHITTLGVVNFKPHYKLTSISNNILCSIHLFRLGSYFEPGVSIGMQSCV